MYICDQMNNRIQNLDIDGRFCLNGVVKINIQDNSIIHILNLYQVIVLLYLINLIIGFKYLIVLEIIVINR